MSLINNIPGQKIGNATETTSRYKAESRHSAVVLFNEARQRLLDINNWERLCGNEGTEFRLTDDKGELLPDPMPVVGNLIRIKLPAWANNQEDNFNWLRIEQFEHSKDLLKDEELFGFYVRPIKNPLNYSMNDDKVHESNSFLICREGCLLTAVEYDISSVETVSLINKLKGCVTAVWLMTGLAKPQWKKLLNGIIKPKFTYA